MNFKSDLAVEYSEQIRGSSLKGIDVRQYQDRKTDINVTVIKITGKSGSKLLGKREGTYITVEAKSLSNGDEAYNKRVAKVVSKYIQILLKNNISSSKNKNKSYSKCESDIGDKQMIKLSSRSRDKGSDIDRKMSILVVGLGNTSVTADALGPEVVEKIDINRHLKSCENSEIAGMIFSAIAPGVMAQTGIETASIIKGVVEKSKPDVIIAVDALAARSVGRLGTTFQISDEGIIPGSGVGNHREEISRESMKIPVISIGVPTVVDAITIVRDIVSKEEFSKAFEQSRDNKLREEFGNFYVTPKDIDYCIKTASSIIASGINLVGIK